MDNVLDRNERNVIFLGIAANDSIMGIFSGLNFNNKWRNYFSVEDGYQIYPRSSQSTPHTITFPVGTRYAKICFIHTSLGTNMVTINGVTYTFDRSGVTLTFKLNLTSLDIYVTNDVTNAGIRYIAYC